MKPVLRIVINPLLSLFRVSALSRLGDPVHVPEGEDELKAKKKKKEEKQLRELKKKMKKERKERRRLKKLVKRQQQGGEEAEGTSESDASSPSKAPVAAAFDEETEQLFSYFENEDSGDQLPSSANTTISSEDIMDRMRRKNEERRKRLQEIEEDRKLFS